ncbi:MULTISPECIES: SDR family NAD(P)-dependent oxidoreductase [Phenylobacterium]|jgi:NAD(P)-dependent dehydrogenase (short-subunit alcohol dehydrogenase family)|uniref:SDR family NAD(P)-dependent oxidoreductase n=1 Tax=Phenylobacterium conjunctum TaxID=1298959 RepID=A0ABW3T450_9CAUL
MGERNDLAGKAALVTGAAGAIGAATVKLLLERGASVAAVDRPGVSFAPLIAACGEAENLVTLEADVSDEGQVADYVSLARQAFGRIDIFFNNAGIEGVVKTVPDYPLEEFQKVMSVNVIGVFLGMKHVIPVMAAQGGGAIINMSSVAGLIGSPGLSAYVASKHAVIGLTRSAAAEWASHGVRINTVNPGPIESRMMRSIEGGVSPAGAQKAHEQFAQLIPAGRYGTPEEVARLVAFLGSDDAAYLNGSVYVVDGGMHAV